MVTTAAKPLALALIGGLTLLAVTRLTGPPPKRARDARRRVVVLGAGFGGLAAAEVLARRPDVDLTVIDANNHHLFQPLLYQVATAALSPADIASPVRGIIPATGSTHVLMETVTGVDVRSREVVCGDHRVPYDELIISTGSQNSYLGHHDWEAAAPGLKTLDDALILRRSILDAFERASVVSSDAEQARLLTFVLIGGGPTGVEMAGAIAELSRDMLTHDYALGRDRARIVLIESGTRVLSGFAADLSDNAARELTRMGVEIRTGTPVTGLEPGHVQLHGETISAGTIIWTAGTEATPVATWLGVAPGHGGRVPVGPDLRVTGRPGIFVIGDAAAAVTPDGKPLPNLAPVAKQQGGYVARNIVRRMQGRRALRPFGYRDYGTLATIGRNKAVAEFGPVHLTGFVAWLTWAVAHIFFLIGFRNRVVVSAQWAFAYVTHQRAARLIIGRANPQRPQRALPQAG